MKQEIFFNGKIPSYSMIRSLTDIYVDSLNEYSNLKTNLDKTFKQVTNIISNSTSIIITDGEENNVIAGLICSKTVRYANTIQDIVIQNQIQTNIIFNIEFLTVLKSYRKIGIGDIMFKLLINNLKARYKSCLLIVMLPEFLESVPLMFDFIKEESISENKEIETFNGRKLVKFQLFYRIV